jgi:hypothetical protein
MRTLEVGLDPVRVLLFGSGPLIGYGVRTRRDAVDGPLARLLAQTTGRGVVIESRVRLSLPTRGAVLSLGGAGTATFQVAVWAPRFSEELEYANAHRYRIPLHTMLGEFRAESAIPLILCELPTPLGYDWRTVLRRPRVAAFNRVLTSEATSWPDVATVAPPAYRPLDTASTGPEWHRRLAEHLVPAVMDALDPTPA